MSSNLFSEELKAVAQTLQKSTVQVQGSRSGMGSGVIWNADGLILTNAHVVRGRGAIVRLADGQALDARVIQRDDRLDLAALVVNASGLPAAKIGSSKTVRVGEIVLAVGNPAGLQNALSWGIVHTTSPEARSRWIQADVPLAPGYSGGPLATLAGEVIGINSMIVDGRAFAISLDTVERFLSSQGDRPFLGATLQPVVIPRRRSATPGWVILDIVLGSPADQGGLRLGDVVIGINDRPFDSIHDLTNWLTLAMPNDTVQFNVLRGTDRLSLAITVGRQPSAREAA